MGQAFTLLQASVCGFALANLGFNLEFLAVKYLSISGIIVCFKIAILSPSLGGSRETFCQRGFYSSGGFGP